MITPPHLENITHDTNADTIKISVIIPAYNIDKYIGECIYSILNQTYTDLEIIVVDDGSIDNTSQIIDSYTEKDNKDSSYT